LEEKRSHVASFSVTNHPVRRPGSFAKSLWIRSAKRIDASYINQTANFDIGCRAFGGADHFT
jgi:hypothetical protein